MDNNQMNNINSNINNQPMNQNMVPQKPKKKFNWILWIGVAVLIPIILCVILKLVASSMESGGVEMMPVAKFISSIGTLIPFCLIPLSTIIVVIIGVTRK